MEIKRITNPEIVKYMHFEPDCDGDVEFYRRDLLEQMLFNSENLFVLVAFEGNEIIGHTCAIRERNNQGKYNNYIWSFNSWSKSSVFENHHPKKEVNGRVKRGIAFSMIKDWAIENFGIHEIRCRTFLDPERLKRIWGWEVLSHEMQIKF